MQNFSNSPATLPPGFPSRGGNLVGSPYPPHISDAQISPRTIEDYAAMQQSQTVLQSHGQHPHLRGQQHLGPTSLIHGYGSRRGVGEIPQATGSSSNSYRKESMDYYFSVSGRDRNRRGGGSFGTGFGYSNMEYQYRHVSTSGPSPGMLSPYPMDYSTSASSAGGSATSNSSGSGSFSPTQQFNMAQNSSMQPVSGAEMHQRQHSQKYPSHQGLQQGHRTYPLSGHRMSHFVHYPPLNVPTASVGMYNSPPQRYEMSSGNMDSKIISPTHSNPNTTPGSAALNNSRHQENAGQNYPTSSHPPYSPQSHPVPKHASRRTQQHNLGAAYDAPLKMQHAPPGIAHTKNHQSSVSLSPAAPHHPSQDISKSPMQSQNQQTQLNQNFSPISNPSPVPSAVHSPSCSSSSSPLMGVSEGLGSSASLHSSLLNTRSTQSHIRAQHTMQQLSPTPSSNSSISSCGSVMSSAVNQNRTGVGLQGGQREETSSLYPQDKLSQDPGLNSLNALTSQVANLPNTVQNTMLTDTVLSQKKRKESAHQTHLHQTVNNQQKHRNANAAGLSTATEERGDVLASELEEKSKNNDLSEHDNLRQPDAFSNNSKPDNYYSSTLNQTQTQIGQVCPGRHLQMDDRITEGKVKQSFSQGAKSFSQIKAPESLTQPSSSPPCVPPEPSPNASSCAPAPSASSSAASSPTHSVQSNCVIEHDLSHSDEKTGLKEKKTSDIKDEKNTVKHEEPSHQELDNGKITQTLASVKVEQSCLAEQNENEKDVKKNSTQHFRSRTLSTPEQSNAGVGVIVSARSEQSPEGLKQTEVKSQHGTLSDMGKLSYPEEKHSINMFKDSGSHNGDGEICMETYTGHYDVSPKTEIGQNMSSNHCQAGSYKYCNPEMPYNACMGAKIKVRAGPGSGIGANRYQDYHPGQSNFGYVSRKDVGVLGVMGKSGVGLRGQDSNSQLQQPYPSLLQEVLQGYHLDRRYCRPEQTSGSRHQPQNMSQHHYQTRLPYRMTENMRPHGMDQSAMGGASINQQMASGKLHSQNQGPELEMGLGLLHPSWDPETQRPKGDQEKGTTTMSPSHSTHLQQSSDLSTAATPKHINLADYSLPHRKTPSMAAPPSTVQELLLQESNQELSHHAESLNQTQSQMSSSERRSVICDVSPSRRTASEKERSHCGTPGSSVIQHPLSIAILSEQGCTKEDVKDKEFELEKVSKINPKELGKQLGDGHSAILPKEESPHAPIEVNSDMHRQSGGKGIIEPSSNALYHSKISSTPLSSPPRCKPYSQTIDGSAAFTTYGFSDTADGPKMNAHHPTPNSFHSLSPSHIPPSVNKLQAYSPHVPLQHTHGIHDRFDWSTSSNRHKDFSILHNSNQNQDQKLSRQHSYPGSHYDMKMWESYAEREATGNQQLHPLTPSHKSVGSVPTSGPKPLETDVSRGVTEDSAKSFHPPVAAGSGTSIITPVLPQGNRQSKIGGSAETNPLMMRRRVRSFISPIPAKRQHQDFSGNRSVPSHHSPVAHSESRQLNDSDSSSVDSRSKLASPNTPFQTPSANSPPQAKTKFLPPRKGRGLKLEAIVQKITPNKKASYSNSHSDADYSDASRYSSDIPDTESPFSNAPHRESSCLPFLDEANSLDDILPYRAEDAYSCDSQALKQGVTGSTGTTLRNLPADFNFGLGTAGSSGPGNDEGDKDEFTLLGPLPPPPPLPRPVQGSPPPSSSALSDIQQFTNTYQQLETRRGEQSAANLLRQKLQETGMGFDDYPGGDFYGATPPHGQSPGHHLLSRPQQIELASPRIPSDSKLQENFVPKGYFPSGKKKGRPVGSVNKQKRVQVQVQSATCNVMSAPHTPPSGPLVATPQPASNSIFAGEAVITSNLPEEKPCPSLDLAEQGQTVKVEDEVEEIQPEVDMKPIKHRQRKGKEGNEATGSKSRQWRKSKEITSKEEQDPQTVGVGNAGTLQDTRKNIFSPYVHVERKITEIGAVCTIVNSEDEKSKGGGKNGASVVDGNSNVSLIAQMGRKEREIERVQEKGIDEPNDSVIQSGKSLPTSGYVLPGPVNSEIGHTGRLLCCLCQKWANYKNLGDLYGPFYPADYAAKFPKNQPQIRQILSNAGVANAGSSVSTDLSNASSVSTDLTVPDIQSVYIPDISSADTSCSVSQTTNPVSPAVSENLTCLNTTTKATEQNWNLMPEGALITLDPPELEKEVSQRRHQKAEEVQQRPQHRKLTSHPRFKRRHKSSEDLPRTIPINSKASLPFQPPPPSLDSLGPLAQLAQLPVVPLDPKELWVHESCIVWTSGVYLVNGRLYGLQEALDGARETNCSHCDMAGSTLGCYSKGCTLRYHYLCAVEADCCLNEDNFSLRCPKHKFPQNSRPAKPAAAHQEQSERG